ncbi:hypothetical protein [Coleofasciculus sp. E2-BRE-01]|uniref:hypothetical protein n=1 Tax=Coleofasciculus sp. E2-BRE-01 TaxID=3069524 RepID=UPI0032F52342
MIRKTLIASTLVLCGTLGFTSAVKAQTTEDVLFDGTIANSCTFENKVDGTLIQAVGTNTLTSTGATAGSVDITCQGAADLTMSAPVMISAPAEYDDATTTKTATATGTTALGANINLNDTDVAAVGLTLGTNSLTVNMDAAHQSTLPAGTYQFGVTLTATPL